MKKIGYFLVALSVLAVGCSDDFDAEPKRSLFVSPTDDIYVSHEGISFWSPLQIKVSVVSEWEWEWMVWETEESESWCKAYDRHAEGCFEVSVSPNDGSEAREAVITVRLGNAPPVNINVYQSVSPFLSISPWADQNVPFGGGTRSIEVKSTISWIVESDKPWAVVQTQSGEGNGSVLVSVAPNPGYYADTAVITFRAGETVRYLQIKRDGNPEGTYLTISQGGYRVLPLSGGEIQVKISSNTSWNVSSDASWAQVQTTEGIGDGTTSIYVASTSRADTTPATILFRAGSLTREFNIYRKNSDPSPEDPLPENKYKHVMEGNSYKVAYTISGNKILEGSSYRVAYTISGNKILEGNSYKVAYTISGNKIMEGNSYRVAYTISGNKIMEGNSYKVAYTLK